LGNFPKALFGPLSASRNKTARHEDVPVVRYKLWPQTFELLRKHRSGDAEVVLLTTGGRRWIETRQTDRFQHSDKVASALKYWLRRAGVKRAPAAAGGAEALEGLLVGDGVAEVLDVWRRGQSSSRPQA
jgi:hypothetical protein